MIMSKRAVKKAVKKSIKTGEKLTSIVSKNFHKVESSIKLKWAGAQILKDTARLSMLKF